MLWESGFGVPFPGSVFRGFAIRGSNQDIPDRDRRREASGTGFASRPSCIAEQEGCCFSSDGV